MIKQPQKARMMCSASSNTPLNMFVGMLMKDHSRWASPGTGVMSGVVLLVVTFWA